MKAQETYPPEFGKALPPPEGMQSGDEGLKAEQVNLANKKHGNITCDVQHPHKSRLTRIKVSNQSAL